MIKAFRKRHRFIASFLLFVVLLQIGYTPSVLALTSGPSQPETQAFQPAGTTEMVDLFTGDFSYNIPLFELPGPNGGYPFNLSYQAGIGMDTEASWVGLGFSLNPGAINRQMRGLPDEFKGDSIYTKMSMEHSVTVGVGIGFGVELFGGALGLGSGLGVYQNNFKGIGYSLDGNVGFQKSVSSGMSAGVGLGFSMDSKEGVNVSPSLSLDTKAGDFGLNAGYNSKQGLTSISVTTKMHTKDQPGILQSIPGGGSATISMANPGYTPMISIATQNVSLSTTFKIGGAFWGVSFTGDANGYYSEQRLKDKGKRIFSPAYGYLNYQHASESRALLDFNREKDGMVTKQTPNLAIPSLTYDIYSVTGQGISAMYRPIRNDFGMIHDQEAISGSLGNGFGVDISIPAHYGQNGTLSYSSSVSGPWTGNNETANRSKFTDKKIGEVYEPWYFKVHGEQTPQKMNVIDDLGGDNAVRVKLKSGKLEFDPVATSTIENRKSFSKEIPDAEAVNAERKIRSNVIQTITNEQLLKGDSGLMSLFNVRYDSAGFEKNLKRKAPGHHTAAFTALTPEGLRYNYGIPAYNLYQEEVTFTAQKQSLGTQTSRVAVVDTTEDDSRGPKFNSDPKFDYANTEKFLKRVELPQYAHSFLLTSIIGPDYVDVTGNGVTPDDLGYWVKFTYTKTASKENPYKWRDPYSGAHYQEGWKTDPRDDKGSFVFGTKEMWYLTKAETKSHIAIFTIAARHDGKGVFQKLQDDNKTGQSVYKLTEIKLFARHGQSNHPIKVVRFDYDYSLCRGVYNNDTEGEGKLTLKKLWFEYGTSTRGSNPYEFTYHENNPSYDQHAYDRWGNYKPYPENLPHYNVDFPYADQDPAHKQQIDANAAAWSLSKIKLPSGGTILVDYESDDYGYVQHMPAMQMTEILSPLGGAAAPGGEGGTNQFKIEDDGKVYFRLQRPVPGSVTSDKWAPEVLKYLDQDRQIFFKIKVNVRRDGEGLFEYISGYATIDTHQPMELHKNSEGTDYTFGSFYLAKEHGAHPFSLRAWQHLRTNQPELANSGAPLKATDSNTERIEQIKSLGNAFTQVEQMFTGFYSWCAKEKFGRYMVPGQSWIRLNSIDRIKYGGGIRVRQITMKDNWTENSDGVYGQVYEYVTEENNETISSGVAAYEPIIGGEENALRYAKSYVESVPLRTSNNLFFEYPINESYYPGPQVGYSKVSVFSLPAASLAGKGVKHITFPKGPGISYGTSGLTVNEFFTAKDFPVITDETDKDNFHFKLSLTVPMYGGVAINKMSTTQGYSIVTNDMHGRQRQVSTFRQRPDGKTEAEPISWVKYNYVMSDRNYQKKMVKEVTSLFKDNGDGTLSLASKQELSDKSVTKYSIGQENEFFTDMREFDDNVWTGGLNTNIDIIYLVFGAIPVPSAWLPFNKGRNLLRTVVANKVIFKTGMIQSVEAFDGGSTVVTENLRWDKNTGAVVLTKVNNNFGDPLYNYTISAHSQYQGMGAAFKNIGLQFTLDNVDRMDGGSFQYTFTSASASKLIAGDEFILYKESDDFKNPVASVVFTGKEDESLLLYSKVSLTEGHYRAMIVRSGYRNQLSVQAGSITALEDPSQMGKLTTHSKTIKVPNK